MVSILGRKAIKALWNPAVLGIGVGSAFLRNQVDCESSQAKVQTSDFLYRSLSKDKTPKNSIEFDTSAPMRARMEALVFRVQSEIADAMGDIDGNKFREDVWERANHGGGGKSCVLQDGKVFEKAGVNVSVVHGMLPPKAIEQMKSQGRELTEGKPLPFYACGISLVHHPHNPMAPTMHLNYRYFEVATGREDENGKPIILSWFGGGADLTPCYLFEDDARHFHAVYKTILDKYNKNHYPEMKKWCDAYFRIPHRGEHRGIGGFFFDDMNADNEDKFQMVRELANAMVDAYEPILRKRINMDFTQEQKQWQQIRRGRYVEFNVMYDRGTKFGLATPAARIESIMMSLPLTARWEYMNMPEPGSWEDRTLQVLKNPTEWLDALNVDLSKLSTGQLFQELAKRSEPQP